MNKPLVFFVAVLFAGAGWFALHRADEGRLHRRDPFSETAVVASDVGTSTLPSARRMSPPNDIPPRRFDAADVPLAFDYIGEQPGPDGSFAVQWDFDATADLHPGDAVRVRLPFATAPYTAVVQEEATVEGIRRITGRLQDDHGVDSWPFSITLSADRQYVAANFETGAAQFGVDAGPGGGRLKDGRAEAAQLDDDAVHQAAP